MIRRALVTSALLAAVTPVCITSSSSDSIGVLRATANNMGRISSGELDLRLSTGSKQAPESGFEVSGPFSLDSPGDLPVGRLEHTRFDGDRRTTNTLVSTGRRAYVVNKRGAFVLGPQDTAALRGLAGRGGGATRMPIDDWIRGTPDIGPGGLIGGVDTDKVTARLDPPAVMNGLVELARGLGSGAATRLSRVSGADAARLRRAVKTATLQVYSGKKDRFLRKLVMHVEFALRDGELARKLESLQGIRIDLEASITDVNKPVRVRAPEGGAVPLPAR